MEVPSDPQDLDVDIGRVEALEMRNRALLDELRALESRVADQQADVVAAKELAVVAAQLELENATLALRLEQMQQRLRARGRDPEPEPVRMVSSLRAASSPRMLAEPELRWVAEIIEAE